MIRSSFGRTVARRLLIGALALLIPAAAGCEAGYNAPTLEFHPASTGAHAVVNGITISNVFVLGPPSGSTLPTGSSASVFLGLFNGGSGDDALVSVAAPSAASGVQLSGGTVSLPAGSPVNLTGPEPAVVLTGLTSPLSGGQAVSMTLNFEHAGTVTLLVPVHPQSYSYATYSPPPALTAPSAAVSATAPGASATPTASQPATGTPSATPTGTPSATSTP